MHRKRPRSSAIYQPPPRNRNPQSPTHRHDPIVPESFPGFPSRTSPNYGRITSEEGRWRGGKTKARARFKYRRKQHFNLNRRSGRIRHCHRMDM